MSVVAEGRGRWAITHYEVIKTLGPPDTRPKHSHSNALWRVSLVHFRLETGRTHQIRVHCGTLGHPLLGDPVYGSHFSTKGSALPEKARAALTALARPALHAAVLGFSHPKTGETLHFERPPPDDFRTLLEALETGL
jgi:23S rRNA pseudouridine1911/1915/1917 synthase